MAGSANEEIVISLDEPMPPNAGTNIPVRLMPEKSGQRQKNPSITMTSALADVGKIYSNQRHNSCRQYRCPKK